MQGTGETPTSYAIAKKGVASTLPVLTVIDGGVTTARQRPLLSVLLS